MKNAPAQSLQDRRFHQRVIPAKRDVPIVDRYAQNQYGAAQRFILHSLRKGEDCDDALNEAWELFDLDNGQFKILMETARAWAEGEDDD